MVMDKTCLLKHFGFLSITGPDAVKFFQGYCTCDLTQRSDSRVMLGATCNLQGRMVANFLVKAIPNGLLLRLNRFLVPQLRAYLQKYIIFSKAEMSDLSESVYCYGLMRDQDTEQHGLYNVSNDGLESPTDALIQVSGSLSIDPGLSQENKQPVRYELWCQLPVDTQLESDTSPWLVAEVVDGHAWVDAVSSEEYLPQMFNLHASGGIDFEKGCYLGQEIVARMHFRGKLTKTLHKGRANKFVQVGAEVFTASTGDGMSMQSAGKIVTAQGKHFLAVIQTKLSAAQGYFLKDKSPVETTNLC